MGKRILSQVEIQNETFKLLLKIKEIFSKTKGKFYLAYGTLLGAIRHEGFIPWDDDIDILVLRNDYECFIKYCLDHEKELLPYKLMHYSTNEKYIYTIARFIDTRYEVKYSNAKEYGLGLFIDIYPLDNFDPKDKKIYPRINRVNRIIANAGYGKFVKNKNILKTIIKFPIYHLYYRHVNINKLLKKNDLLSQKYLYQDTPFLACLCCDQRMTPFKKEYFNKDCYKLFNNEEFLIPNGYDEILKILYGDYLKLPPKEEQIGHHFYDVYYKD